MSIYLVQIQILLDPRLKQLYSIQSVHISYECKVGRLFTESFSEFWTGIFSKRWKRTSIDLLISGLHTKHSFGPAVALLGEVIDDL